jgi:uncharacterized protein YbbC (DUF1343 family)
MLHPGYESFVGQFPIPMRHGMTIGELACLFNERFGSARSSGGPMDGWSRAMYWDATTLPWVMPSPNMPTLDTAILYPGTVLFEGTQLSEGRGTTRPFELVGAPWIDAETFAATMNARRLPGVHFRPPSSSRRSRSTPARRAAAARSTSLDRKPSGPARSRRALLLEFYRADPSRFAWRPPPYEYEHDKEPIDILAGSDALRQQVEAQASLEEIVASWERDSLDFQGVRRSYLLY